MFNRTGDAENFESLPGDRIGLKETDHLKQRIIRNSGFLFLSRVISYILIFLYIMYVVRYLGAEGFGVLTFALALTGIAAMLMDPGFSVLTVKEVARDHSLAGRYLNNIFGMKLVLGCAVFFLVVVFVSLYSQSTSTVVLIICASVFLNVICEMFYSIFQAYEKLEYQAFSRVLNSVLMILGALYAIERGLDVVGFAWIYFFTSCVVLGYNLLVSMRRFFIPGIEVDVSWWKAFFKRSLPFGITGVSTMVYTHTDSIMLSLMQTDAAVGWYNAAYRLSLVLLFIPTTVNQAIFAPMSRLHLCPELEVLCERYFRTMLTIAIPLGLGITLLADDIILLIFGQGFSPSAPALQILIWSVVITFAGAAFVKLFEATDRQVLITKLSLACAGINILINLILIPEYSFIGAGIATLITEFILVGGVMYIAFRTGYRMDVRRLSGRIMVASLLMGGVIVHVDWNVLLVIPVGAIVYFAVLYVLGERLP